MPIKGITSRSVRGGTLRTKRSRPRPSDDHLVVAADVVELLKRFGNIDLAASHDVALSLLQDKNDLVLAECVYDFGIWARPEHPSSWQGKALCQQATGSAHTASEFAVAALARCPSSLDASRLLLQTCTESRNEYLYQVVLSRHVKMHGVSSLEGDPHLGDICGTKISATILDQFEDVLEIIRARRPHRYSQLYQILISNAPQTILEVGVYNGDNALKLISCAAALSDIGARGVRYYGFDLFEDLTPAQKEREFSKYPLRKQQVQDKLKFSGARVKLFRGYSSVELPRFSKRMSKIGRNIDFIFIDGGHKLDTIKSDWSACKDLIGENSIVIFDDYYLDRPRAIAGFGCNDLIDEIKEDRDFSVHTLPVVDQFEKEFGILNVCMVRVARRV